MLEDDEDTVESIEDWKDEDWEHPTVEVGSLSEDLLKFDEELKRQIEEDKAWLEEEEKADQLLRRDIEQLQLTEEKNKEFWDKLNCPEPVLQPEVQERINELENKVKNLEEQLEEKNGKLQERYESSAEILAKLNDTTKRMIENDKIFKESFEKVRGEYGELEAVLKGKLDSYQKLNKDLELRLNEKEAEIQEFREANSEVEELKNQLSDTEKKLEENIKTLENIQKHNTKLKAQLKIIKTERDQLKKDDSVNTEDLKNKISQLEEEITKLNKEKQDEENVELLKNKITLLEEEKGNLQLQLVDLDELKESLEVVNRKFNDTVRNYEEARKVVEETEERNRQLVSNFTEAKDKVEQYEDTLVQIKINLDAVSQEKISAIMKCVEIEDCLQTRERELASLKESLAVYEKDSAAQAEIELMSDYNMSNGLQMKLTEAQEELIRLREQTETLSQLLDGVQTENSALRGQLAEAASTIDRIKREEVTTDQNQEEVRFKKLAAKYKIKVKQCQNLEESLTRLKEQIENYEAEISRLMELGVNPEAERNQEIAITKEKLLYCLKQLRSVSKESLYTVIDANNLDHLLIVLENWESDSPDCSYKKQSDDELNNIIKQKDDLISVMEKDKLKLEDTIKANEMELEMLRTLYEKESAKNESFMMDLKNLESEMTEGKDELLSRFKELTEIHGNCESTLQERENYIELLEQDVMNMKQRVLDLEENMEGRQNELKGRTEQLMGKLEEAELMTQNFHVYREQVEKRNRELMENEAYLKDKVVNLQVELEISEETCELVKKSNLNLERDREAMETRLEEMTQELENLREIKEAYNNTLDKIEFLNEELKEAMEGFEKKTELLATLESEREKLIRKVSDLEVAFNEMEAKLNEAYNETDRLKNENEAFSRGSNQGFEQREFYENKIAELERALKETENKLVEFSQGTESNQMAEVAVDLFADKDDEGWGWSGDVGPLDAGFANQKYLEVEAERNSLSEELNALRIKNQKLMKKVKEMKMEHEVLSRSKQSNVGFTDLDFALQEELSQEIDKMQGKMAELNNQIASLKAEKENLTGRVDTLTSANYELVDMKERQDIEVQMWQKRSNELMAQVQSLQRSTEVTSEENDQSLKESFAALADENEELKQVLCGKKDELERAFLREQDLEEELNEVKKSYDKKLQELESLEMDVIDLKKQLSSSAQNPDLQQELTLKTNAYNTLMSLNQELESQLRSLENCIDQQRTTHEEEIVRLKQQIDDLDAQIDQQNSIKTEDQNVMIHETEELKSSLEEKTIAIELLTLKCQELENKTLTDTNLSEELTRLKSELSEREVALSSLRSQYEDLKNREKHLAESLAKKDKELQNVLTKNTVAPSMSSYFDSSVDDPFSGFASSQNEEKIEVDRLKKENAELKEALETLQLTFQQLQNNSNMLVKQMDAFREETSALMVAKDTELRGLNIEVNSLKSKDRSLEEKVNELIQENDTLKNDIDGFQMYQDLNLKEFNNQIEKYNKLNVEKDAEINKLKEILENDQEEIKSLKTELENYKIHSESINYELTKRNELIKELESKLTGHSHKSEDSVQTRLILEELQLERSRLEFELEEKLVQVDQYEKLVESLRNAPPVPSSSPQENLSNYLEMIKDKDGEINRLTKTLIETQEKLLLAEQGKMYPDVRNLQLKHDQALYTLHERDLRCEELTQEVIQLLEERDVLQLRLSQAIRAYDALKKNAGVSGDNLPTFDEPPSPIHSRTEKIEYRKDPVVQHERETRHNQMMQLYTSETPHPPPQDETSGGPLDYGIFNWFFGGSPSSQQPHQIEGNNS